MTESNAVVGFIVTAPHDWFMRGTVWSGDRDRATVHPTEEDAQAAITRAAKFAKARAVKTWRIEPVFG